MRPPPSEFVYRLGKGRLAIDVKAGHPAKITPTATAATAVGASRRLGTIPARSLYSVPGPCLTRLIEFTSRSHRDAAALRTITTPTAAVKYTSGINAREYLK